MISYSISESQEKLKVPATDISSTIDTDAYVPKTEYARSNNLTFTLGWSGSHSTSKYLYLLTPVFKKLKELGYDFKIKVMGDPNFYIEGISVEAFPWDETYEVDVIRGFDIGLYPLPDEKWIYGKSGLKALQYMGLGVPTIATALGTNFRIIQHGINGIRTVGKLLAWNIFSTDVGG